MKSQTLKYLVLSTALVILMALTRSHHFDSINHLPDASLAVFLLAGFFLPQLAFPVLLIVAGGADYVAFNYVGISDWCFSPAYWFLIPTYAVIFYAGRYYRSLHQDSWMGLSRFTLTALLATSAAFVISNMSFYAFSGRYAEMTVTQYVSHITQYYLPYMSSAFMYLLPAVLLRVLYNTGRHAQTSATR